MEMWWPLFLVRNSSTGYLLYFGIYYKYICIYRSISSLSIKVANLVHQVIVKEKSLSFYFKKSKHVALNHLVYLPKINNRTQLILYLHEGTVWSFFFFFSSCLIPVSTAQTQVTCLELGYFSSYTPTSVLQVF